MAVLAYSKHKEGVDAGALVGIGEVGLKATTDVSRFLAAKPDCVSHGDGPAGNSLARACASVGFFNQIPDRELNQLESGGD